MSQQETKDMAKYLYRASAEEFTKIPGAPIVYWASEAAINSFSYQGVEKFFDAKKGMAIGDNARFLRIWPEVSANTINFSCGGPDFTGDAKWYPCLNGGSFRKWGSNREYVVNWKNNGEDPKQAITKKTGDHWSRYIISTGFFFKPGINWTAISSSSFSARYHSSGFAFTSASMCAFAQEKSVYKLLGLVNSKVGAHFLSLLSPTLNFGIAELKKIPYTKTDCSRLLPSCVEKLIDISDLDWNSKEFSWNFEEFPLLKSGVKGANVAESFQNLILCYKSISQDFKDLEEEINEELIRLYGLEDELTSEVDWRDVSLYCNPEHSFGCDKPERELESLQQCETVKELVSYAIGCMMGRYSVDKSGLILASQGATKQDYLHHVPSPRFVLDDDAILSLTDQEWFAEDVTNRFCEFVRVLWGDEHLQENLNFVAESLCLHAIKPKRGESAIEAIRRYLSTQFFRDHLRTYKKRPIYWLFSSGKNKAFECLVYLHRYNEGTLARMRTEYVLPLSSKLNNYVQKLEEDRDQSTSAAEIKRLDKEIDKLHKQQVELAEFDEKLRHYADQRISLDLDDGVKVNYGKFGDLLANVKEVTGNKPE